MDRRQFLARSGFGVAAVAVGGVAAGAGVDAQDRHRARIRCEAQDYSGDGLGAQRIWWSLDTDRRVAALTFDDGPQVGLTARVLATLASHNVHATFFMIGCNAMAHRSLVADVVAGGHEIANHTWSHGRLVEQDRVAVRNEILRGARAIRSLTGQDAMWFRPPRGMVDGDVLSGAAVARSEVVLWSVSRGGPSVRGSAAVLAHLTRELHPGAIIDLHDGTGINPSDADRLARRHEELAILPTFLTRAIAAGYRFDTVSDLIAAEADIGTAPANHESTAAQALGNPTD